MPFKPLSDFAGYTFLFKHIAVRSVINIQLQNKFRALSTVRGSKFFDFFTETPPNPETAGIPELQRKFVTAKPYA